MPRFIALSILSVVLISSAVAGTEWAFAYRPVTANYAIYGGDLGDPVTPRKENSKVAFEITDKAAKDVFDLIGPDKTDQCASESGTRFRSKDDGKLVCTRSAKGRYSCYFGFDLKTGGSIGGSIC